MVGRGRVEWWDFNSFWNAEFLCVIIALSSNIIAHDLKNSKRLLYKTFIQKLKQVRAKSNFTTSLVSSTSKIAFAL